MTTITADVIVIGAGIAGASAACELADDAQIIILEQEDQPGYHTTGRSAAIYTQNYGNRSIRALTLASHDFLSDPDGNFTEHPLMTPRGALFVARDDQIERLEPALEQGQALVPSICRVDSAEAVRINPAMRRDYVAAAIYEPHAMDIDVHGLHSGFLRRLRQRGGQVVTNAGVISLSRGKQTWVLETRAGQFEAPVVINAAGAWADVVGQMAGAKPIGLQPKRRTVMTFPAPENIDISGWPLTIDIDEEFYFKSDAGVIMASPADETPSAPCDAQPEELDIAIAADRVEKATVLQVRRILSSWAGLRSFLPDKTPVVGFDDQAEGFFWLAGQGGYGIQTSPAMGQLTAALVKDGRVPATLLDLGVRETDLSVHRLRK